MWESVKREIFINKNNRKQRYSEYSSANLFSPKALAKMTQNTNKRDSQFHKKDKLYHYIYIEFEAIKKKTIVQYELLKL